MTFLFEGRIHEYYPIGNDRAVEVPIAQDLLSTYVSSDVLEVGNVLAHYGFIEHQVIDKYEHGINVIQKDIVEFDSGREYKCIICISTLEHIGYDHGEMQIDYDKPIVALNKMLNMLNDDGQIFATVPLGYHPNLDRKLIYNCELPLKRYYMIKDSDAQWHQGDQEEAAFRPFIHKPQSSQALLILMKR